jgi:signal transduction histidine kinase
LLESGGTLQGTTMPLLQELVDQLPFAVALHDITEGFPVVYRNRRDKERLLALPADRARARDPRLRELAERVLRTRRGDHLEISVRDRSGGRLTWDWIMTPILDDAGEVVGMVSVVEDLSSPVIARQRLESAVRQGMTILLSIAQLAEERASIPDFLDGVAEQLAILVGADRVAFNEYHPERRMLVRAGEHDRSPAGHMAPHELPCDPDAADLLAQVVFAGRVFRGPVDFDSFEFRPYAQVGDLGREAGTQVCFVPWRAGTQRLGVVVAQRPPGPQRFTTAEGMLLTAAGHSAGLVCQRKHAEQKLAERASELESLEQAKSSFLRLASHELRAPLTLLNGYLSMLSDPELKAADRDEIMPILTHATTHMNHIVTQLMDANQVEDGKLTPKRETADLREVVRAAVDNVLPIWRLERGGDFDMKMPAEPITIVLDMDRTQMIVQNLLDNSFKYSKPGDRVSCSVRVDGDRARVVVRDDGIGISPSEMRYLFSRFGRVVNERNSHIGGTGLGLHISRQIARLQGGDILARSTQDEGSRFELWLPRDGAGGDGDSKERT